MKKLVFTMVCSALLFSCQQASNSNASAAPQESESTTLKSLSIEEQVVESLTEQFPDVEIDPDDQDIKELVELELSVNAIVDILAEKLELTDPVYLTDEEGNWKSEEEILSELEGKFNDDSFTIISDNENRAILINYLVGIFNRGNDDTTIHVEEYSDGYVKVIVEDDDGDSVEVTVTPEPDAQHISVIVEKDNEPHVTVDVVEENVQVETPNSSVDVVDDNYDGEVDEVHVSVGT